MSSGWPADYNAQISMENAMDTASKVMKAWQIGDVPTAVAEVQFHQVDVWVRIAQVHATNMLTEAVTRLGELRDSGCREPVL